MGSGNRSGKMAIPNRGTMREMCKMLRAKKNGMELPDTGRTKKI